MSSEPIRATVVIPTFNGEVYLRRILEAVLAQQLDGSLEVLVIDSGSTDATLEIVRAFPSVRLHEIPNSEFGHGRTRNLAAQLARGEYVAYLTHDAIPATDRWLHELLAPFGLNDRVVAVMGKQVARESCFPLMKYEFKRFFTLLGPQFGTTMFYDDGFPFDAADRAGLTFYSDVNSAARRDILTGPIPYKDVSYAEDQLFGRDVIEAGYYKVYAPRAAVEHSNDLTLHEFGPRIFEETIALRRIGTSIPPMSFFGMLARIVKGNILDTVGIVLDREFSPWMKVSWLVRNPAYQATKWWNYRRATRADLSDHGLIASASLEHRRKARARRHPESH